ncbi:aldo/keto reductase [Phenylobacterium sp.]|uniref:aldo/keto reductase n=1 Tax=Phenylobacterium sp. TaxID=1871053 RepID=UPI0035AE2546
MQYRSLGRSGLVVSEIGYGCASWWGKPRFPEADALGLVHAAIDLGVTFFDTGASYSAGEAEPRLGRALADRDVSRLVIATKAGTFHAGGGRIVRDFSPSAIVASAERSLRHLGVEAISLLQLHGPAIPELTDELLSALEDLKRRGLVRALGVNSFDPAVVEHVLGLAPFDAVMIDYNVLRPEREPLIERAAAAGKGVLAGMALAMGHTGLKVAKIRGPQDLWYAARGLVRHRDEVRRGARFAFLHRQRQMTGSQAALAYVLENAGVSCAVLGTTRMAHLRENAGASGMTLPPDLRAAILRTQGR